MTEEVRAGDDGGGACGDDGGEVCRDDVGCVCLMMGRREYGRVSAF